MEFFTLLLIPMCAYLNNQGGRNDLPRLVFRSVFISLAFVIFSLAAGVSAELGLKVFITSLIGTAFWAVWKWGPGFMALDSTLTDNRDYTTPWWHPNTIITHTVDELLMYSPLIKLRGAEIQAWGCWYMAFRGIFLYPFFIALAHLLTPWALLFGLLCLAQGACYRESKTVSTAEYFMGALGIGLPMALTILAYMWGS